MARPSRDAIQTYMSITGASESLALQRLEEHRGNLNEAVNAHFSGGDIDITNPSSASPQYDSFSMNSQSQPQCDSFSMNNQNQYDQHMNNQSQYDQHGLLPMLSALRSFRPSLLLDPNYRRGFLNQIGAAGFTGPAPLPSYPGEVRGIPVEPNSRNEELQHLGLRSSVEDVTRTSMPHSQGIQRNRDAIIDDPTDLSTSRAYHNDIEEEMIQAAIRASTQEADLSGNELPERQFHQEDEDFVHAVSLSLKTAEQEEALREKRVKDYNEELGIYSRLKPGSSSHKDEAGNVKQLHQLRHESNRSAGGTDQHSKDAFPFEEWGGISSKELDEAAMLETALFGEISEAASYSGPDKTVRPDQQPVRHPQSSSLAAHRVLREQQDKEYLASLSLDKEKERNAFNEAEACHSKEESNNTQLNEVEYERRLAAKKASLPCQPASDDENAVTVLVRMPNGSRLGRRFLKSDKLQLLLDFIDIDGTVKSGTYRVVRSYPRRAFGVDDSLSSLSELGLTNKQEALFLELI
ncbi:hypothetical protein FNV43_RR15189 [Rhamnella rubrinervis]|uniref:UBX domain-containing protein n=1 Tax=Rhamnella rubrinervis TaxID=2594499 RepID=A0A8K0E2X0_9ROSA|nr:hypothetical protein FNV43_RR15189 [Rhamnella rubrinervis]